MTIYLLFAIGLKGGAKLDGVTFGEFWKPLAAVLAPSSAIPLWSYAILREFLPVGRRELGGDGGALRIGERGDLRRGAGVSSIREGDLRAVCGGVAGGDGGAGDHSGDFSGWQKIPRWERGGAGAV